MSTQNDTNRPAPLFKIRLKTKGMKNESQPFEHEVHAISVGNEAIKNGASFVALLRDDRGNDHPDNAGKFFLIRFLKA